MNAREFGILVIRLLAIYLFVRSVSYLPETVLQTPPGLATLLVLIGAIVFDFVVPLLLWVLAPVLAAWILPDAQGKGPISASIDSHTLYQLGVSLVGLLLIPMALVSLISVGYQLFAVNLPESVEGATRFPIDIDSVLRSNLLRNLMQLALGILLFLKPSLFLRAVERVDRFGTKNSS